MKAQEVLKQRKMCYASTNFDWNVPAWRNLEERDIGVEKSMKLMWIVQNREKKLRKSFVSLRMGKRGGIHILQNMWNVTKWETISLARLMYFRQLFNLPMYVPLMWESDPLTHWLRKSHPQCHNKVEFIRDVKAKTWFQIGVSSRVGTVTGFSWLRQELARQWV